MSTYRAPSRGEVAAVVALLACVSGLIYSNWVLMSWQPEISAAVRSDDEREAARASATQWPPQAKVLSLPDNRAFADILARPLFDATRRPPVAAPIKPPPPPPPAAIVAFPADKYKLVGIMRTPSKPARALLRAGPADPGIWIDEGGTLAGWRLDRIGDDRVVFVANGAMGTLKLSSGSPAKDK